jgi:predicted Rossmann fold nucleotide-binding protein DprA/Smf involved in DNA uptake
LDALKDGALDIDQIILATKLPAQTVISAIPIMELNGIIKNIEANTYAIKLS